MMIPSRKGRILPVLMVSTFTVLSKGVYCDSVKLVAVRRQGDRDRTRWNFSLRIDR